MKNFNLSFLLIVLLLSACGSSKSSEPTTDPNFIYTSAAETVSVQLTHNAQMQPSETPTNTATTAQNTATISITTPTVGSTQTPAPSSTHTVPVTQDRVEYLEQDPQDGAVLAPQEDFQVTWQIRNVGETIWTTSYSVRFFSGDRIGAGLPNSYAFTNEVAPGETYSITVNFKTGTELGEFQSNWVLTNDEGNNFYPLYIAIRVDNPTPTVTSTETLTPTPTESVTPTP